MTEDRLFNFRLARDAQEKFCRDRGIPNFSPFSGICTNCFRNIYYPDRMKSVELRGISVDDAASRLITSCPHCSASFID